MKRKRIFTTLNYIEPLAVLRYLIFLPPANEVCEGYVFTLICLSTGGGGVHGRGHACTAGGHACVAGGMRGRGACMAGRCTWQGVMHGRGTCMAGDHAWQEGMRGRGAWHTPPGRYHEIRSMSGRYASYWNAFLFLYPITQAIKPGFGVCRNP